MKTLERKVTVRQLAVELGVPLPQLQQFLKAWGAPTRPNARLDEDIVEAARAEFAPLRLEFPQQGAVVEVHPDGGCSLDWGEDSQYLSPGEYELVEGDEGWELTISDPETCFVYGGPVVWRGGRQI